MFVNTFDSARENYLFKAKKSKHFGKLHEKVAHGLHFPTVGLYIEQPEKFTYFLPWNWRREYERRFEAFRMFLVHLSQAEWRFLSIRRRELGTHTHTHTELNILSIECVLKLQTQINSILTTFQLFRSTNNTHRPHTSLEPYSKSSFLRCIFWYTNIAHLSAIFGVCFFVGTAHAYRLPFKPRARERERVKPSKCCFFRFHQPNYE